MELALTALASFGAEAAIAGGAAAGAAAAGTAAAGGGTLLGFLGSASTLSLLAGGLTAVSVLQKLNAGELQAQQAEFKAREAKIEGIGEQAAGASRAAALKRNLLKVLGENDVAYAASGIDLSYGEAASARTRETDRAEDELSIDRATTAARMAGYDARAAAYGRMSRGYRAGSLLDAVVTGGEGVLRAGRRG